MAKAKPIGRPSSFTQTVADAICLRIALGESLRKICDDADMPHQATVFRWLEAQPPFREQYARARDLQADTKFDEVGDISDAATPEDAQVARLRIDARKWQSAKLAPKRYGDATNVRVSNPEGGPVEMAVVTAEATPDQAAEIYKKLLG